jgi:outer membrane lipoprotein SlyB
LKTTYTMMAAAIAASAFLSGCAAPEQQNNGMNYPATQPAYSNANQNPQYATYYGVVNSIQMTPGTRASGGVGVGAVVGGVVGGLLGNQVGGGNGKTVATVAGVGAGAVVGHQIEQRNRANTPDMYQISVRVDNGGYQTIAQDTLNDLRVGDRARIENGRVYRF